ncbi:T9SS type A sorting domain-containing protein [Flavobacterium sp. SUN052]|uniref:DUF7619 domain-containing protein n=1 Tax=Flavobacterium sp. SUN052 TaxID=3002441 RepID=UPI00237DD81A|nr:T9SS type A sorting domain-containing protein [Flavobacterium sp. SUN052]MEC4004597.1 T9SS type A sorting domain-containing protein [Flavobacterium sp. SUN052]
MKKQLLLTLFAVIGLTNLSIYAQAGFTCNQAIAITSLPYTTTDNTANYGDTYDVIQPSSCVSTSGNYMGGNDVFYSYTPTVNETINIRMTPTSSWSGIFVYDGCANVGVTCVGGVANGTNSLREIASLNVTAGHTYIIAISTFPTPQTVGYTLQIQTISCPTPSLVTTSSITTNSLNLAWNSNSNSSTWELYFAPCGTPAPSATTSGIIVNSNPYTVSNLNPATCYTIYIRSLCSATDKSLWSSGTIITTLSTPAPTPVCGGQFIDNGGLNGNYANNTDDTYLICPTNAGDQVTVTFASFNTESGWDGLYVFDGNSIASPQISSSNSAGDVPGGLAGAFWGTTIPGSFTSSSPDGCLTFRFRSDGSVNAPGWVANVTCAPPSSCPKPNAIVVSNTTYTSANFTWTETGTATQWEVLLLSAGTAPTATSTGTIVNSNTYLATGLNFNTTYNFYVRAICSTSDVSLWSNVKTFSTQGCLVPTQIVVNSITSSSATINWSGTTSQYEIIVQLASLPIPSATSVGVTVTSSPYLASGLLSSTAYKSYVRSICSSLYNSNWTSGTNFTTLASVLTTGSAQNLFSCNDTGTNCFNLTDNDTNILANLDPSLYSISYYSSLADASNGINAVLSPVCITNTTATYYAVLSQNGTTSKQSFTFTIKAISYNPTQTLNNLAECDDDQNGSVIFDLTSSSTQISTTNTLVYYPTLLAAQTETNAIVNPSNFSVSVATPNTTVFVRESILNACDNIYSFNLNTYSTCNLAHVCNQANSLCSALGNPFTNTTGFTSGGTVSCLFTTPNPTWFYLPVSSPGTLNLTIVQSTNINFTSNMLDVDYIVYGPFSDPVSPCNTSLTAANMVSCSYSGSATEHPVIPNALVGQYYLIMVTNFSNQAGFIRITMDATSTGAIDCSGLRLNSFLDTNNNGTQDTGEVNFPLGQFQYDINNGVQHNITAPTGIYNIYDTDGTNSYNLGYTIDPAYSSMYAISTTAYNNVHVIIGGGMVTYNFPVTILQSYNDLAVAILPFNSPRAGTTYTNKLVYSNLGNQTITSGTVTFNNDSVSPITNISQTGTNPITNGFTYNFSDLLPFEARIITVTMQVPPLPTVSIGQLLTNTASITPMAGDVVTSNNSSTSAQHIIAAYDPNDKIESHGDKILFSSFAANDYLFYTIRFENTGSASAIDVKVQDILDSKVDETSIKMVNASHDFILDRVGNTLTWNFNNIQLPVSVANSEIGKGYITFKVKLKPGFSVGDIIPNTASIYFDSNPAIVTNTFQSEFVAALANAIFESNNLLLYPNPAHSSVQINLQNTSENLSSIIIYDVVGKNIKTIKNLTSNEMSIDVSDLSKGVYLVEIATETNLKVTKKLVIN